MKTFCQLLILCFVCLTLLLGLWADFHGRPAKEPYGFAGAITSIIVTLLLALIFWKAGAFSNFLPEP